MSIFNWFSKTQSKTSSATLPQGAQDFLDGKKNILTSADIDPKGAALFDGFEKAMELKKEGKLYEAESLLIKSTEPPSIYEGHYRELFKIWRQFNRDDIKANKYQDVTKRVLKMHCLDEEMIQEMLRYWGIRQNRKLPKKHFDNHRNLLVSDAKALKKSAESLQDEENIALAERLIERFFKK